MGPRDNKMAATESVSYIPDFIGVILLEELFIDSIICAFLLFYLYELAFDFYFKDRASI